MKQTLDNKMVMRQYHSLILYVLAMFGMGIWQLIDWHYGTEDPIWHLLFYIFFMPICSLAYGIAAGEHKRPYLIPPVAGLTCAVVYICMANGGFSVDFSALESNILSALELSGPSFISASVGVMICRISMWVHRGIIHEERKASKPRHDSSDSRI